MIKLQINKTPIVLLVSVPSRNIGLAISRSLIENRLAACVQLSSPVNAIYRWKGSIEEDEEFVLSVKTHRELFKKIEEQILRLHPYEVPQIIALKVDSITRSYYDWLCEETED